MSADLQASYEEALVAALSAGHVVLGAGGTAIAAVEAAVQSMEDCPLFNAGKGAVFTNSGIVEMGAHFTLAALSPIRLVQNFARRLEVGIMLVRSLLRIHVSYHRHRCIHHVRPLWPGWCRGSGAHAAQPDWRCANGHGKIAACSADWRVRIVLWTAFTRLLISESRPLSTAVPRSLQSRTAHAQKMPRISTRSGAGTSCRR